MKLLNQEQTLSLAAAKSGMDEKTARKYRRLRKLPSEMNKERDWRTREDSFKEMWEKVRSKLELNPGLQAKTLFKDLQRRHPGKFQDGQLRTLQRRVKEWRALEGPPKEVFFEQRHEPGELSQSDFTHMNGLGVREVRVHAEELQVWYAQRQVDTLPRLRGSGKHRIQYRHIIDWLVRKPGAFEHYRYREELFPTTQFRMAYDRLHQHFALVHNSGQL